MPLGVIEMMGGKYDSLALSPEMIDVFGDDLADQDIQPPGRLVHEHHGRAVNEGAGQIDALTLTGAQGAAALVNEIAEPEKVDEAVEFGECLRERHGIEVGEEKQHLADGQAQVKPRGGRDEADTPFDLIGIVAGTEAGDGRLAARGPQQAQEHAQGGRLAGAVGAKQAVDFPGRHREGQVVYRGKCAAARQRKAFSEVVDLDHARALYGALGFRRDAAVDAVGRQVAGLVNHPEAAPFAFHLA